MMMRRRKTRGRKSRSSNERQLDKNLLDTKLVKRNRVGLNTDLKGRQIYSLEAVA